MNVYTEVFPLISKISQSKFYSYDNVNHTQDETKNWLNKKGKSRLSKKQGLEVWMYNMYWNKALNVVNGNVVVRATKDITYLLEKEFVFQYDTLYVRPFGVKNGSINISRFKGNPTNRQDKIPEATLTKNYTISSEDITANRFKVKIKANSLDDLGQLQLMIFNQRKYTNILFSLDFKIKQNIVKRTFALSLISKPFKNVGKYYDPIAKQKGKFAYQRVITPEIKSSISNAYPVIKNVTPSKFSVGDTLSISGENLAPFKDRLYCPCTVTERNIEFRRHCLVPKKNVILSTYEELKFVVPKEFDFNKDKLTKLFPATGTIKVKYEQSEQVIMK